MSDRVIKYIKALLEEKTSQALMELNRKIDMDAGEEKILAAAGAYAAAKRAETEFFRYERKQAEKERAKEKC